MFIYNLSESELEAIATQVKKSQKSVIMSHYGNTRKAEKVVSLYQL